jgi:hypothetical protein
MSAERDVIGVEIDVVVKSGKDLVAKDGGLFSKKSSDPYVKIQLGSRELSRTPTIEKTLNPVWGHACKFMLAGRELKANSRLVFAIFDRDKASKDDPMGEVSLPIAPLMNGQVSESWHRVANCPGCKNATGELQLRLTVLVRRALTLQPHDSVPISDRYVAAGLGWDMLPGNRAIDLDASCVCLSARGDVLPQETVFFGRLCSESGAIRHTGDEKEGDEDLGQGDDEIITVDCELLTAILPDAFTLLYFI